MRSKYLIGGIIVILLTTFIVQSTSIELTEKSFISPNKNDTLFVGGSGPGNYTRIQDAIDDANNGDIVFVYDDSSPYFENLHINKSIHLIGENKNTTIINGSGSYNVIFITADHVNITGFKIQNSGNIIYAGIFARSNNNTIHNNICTKNVFGIELREGSHNKVYNNQLVKDSTGIFLYKSKVNRIFNNTILRGSKFGIYLFINSKNNIITDNTITTFDRGIFLSDVSSNKIYKNTISNCSSGILGDEVTNHTISNNHIFNNQVGISIHKFSNSEINQNIIQSSNQALYVKSSSSNNVISNNTITNNMKGIYLFFSSNNNKIENNTFQKNFRNVYFQDSSNSWNHNYWGRPKAIPKIILGGKTIWYIGGYVLPWLEIDWHPAKEPFKNEFIGDDIK